MRLGKIDWGDWAIAVSVGFVLYVCLGWTEGLAWGACGILGGLVAIAAAKGRADTARRREKSFS